MGERNRHDRRAILKASGAAIGSLSLAGCTAVDGLLGGTRNGSEGYAAERGREAVCDAAGRREDIEDQAENNSLVETGNDIVDTVEETLVDPIVSLAAPLKAAYEHNRENMAERIREGLRAYPEAGREFGFWTELWGEPRKTNLDVDDTVVGLESYENTNRVANSQYVVIKLQTSRQGNYADLSPNHHLPLIEDAERWYRDRDIRTRFKPIAETVAYHAIEYYVGGASNVQRAQEFREDVGHVSVVIGGVYGGYARIAIPAGRVERIEQGIAAGTITGPEGVDLAYDEVVVNTDDCLHEALASVANLSETLGGKES